MNCLFCAIIKGDIPSNKVYEDDKCYAFLDIAPQAPVHCLVVPKEHIASVDEISEENSAVVAHIFTVIPKIAKDLGLAGGYRIVSNIGDDGCQSVKHLHVHILGGGLMPRPNDQDWGEFATNAAEIAAQKAEIAAWKASQQQA